MGEPEALEAQPVTDAAPIINTADATTGAVIEGRQVSGDALGQRGCEHGEQWCDQQRGKEQQGNRDQHPADEGAEPGVVTGPRAQLRQHRR